jgi:enamidase
VVADVVIENIGTIVSGDLNAPLIEGKTIVVRDGRVAEIGSADQVSANGIEHRIDADGSTVVPGLIDSHIHPVLGDFTPRQNTVGFLESYVHGGVTTAISVGEVHAPGRPKDAEGTKALAILAAKAFRSFRPNGMKILGGAVLLERGLTREDFKEMAAAGVRLV